MYHAKRWSELLGGAQIYFKREDLNHTGAHKINNVIGQALLAKLLGGSASSPENRRRPARRRDCDDLRALRHGNASSTWAAKTSSASCRTSTA